MNHCVHEVPLKLPLGMDDQDIARWAIERQVLPDPLPGLLDVMAVTAGHGVVHRINVLDWLWLLRSFAWHLRGDAFDAPCLRLSKT